MSETPMPLDKQLELLQVLVSESLALWDVPKDATARLINVSENATYLVEGAGGYRAVLRVHREGYHSKRAIECELAWLDALRAASVIEVPACISGRDGQAIQSAGTAGLGPRYLVLFAFIEGDAPDETGDLTAGFRELGSIAARCHEHVHGWRKPDDFQRLTWDLGTVFGANPTWGDWRDAPGVSDDIRNVLERVESCLRSRLTAFGKDPARYNLIHADMRLANLLVGAQGTRLIDFDDSGFGWLMYDFAAAISFMEDDARVPALKAAWLEGYRSVRALPEEDEAEIDSFVMLRRMALLAWIGSHIDAPEPQKLADGFATTTAELGAAYLSRFG